jgi:NAD(P)-dependent dehydrogenase (short-subunit alcohol dehydrogenase family)
VTDRHDDDDLAQARERWEGRVAVITGAAGGLGSAFADVASSIGMDLVLTDVDAAGLEALATRIEAAGGRATTMVTDVRDYDAVEALADAAFAAGDVALLVNNAGIEHVGLIWEEPPEAWHRVIDINLNGVYHGVRAFVPRMLEAGRPAVVFNLGSVASLTSGAQHAVYQVSKHGVLALSEALADGLASTGAPVQVSGALPGPVDTRIYADANAGAPGEHVDAMRTMIAAGMAPAEAARLMLAQVASGAFAVSPHPEWVQRMAAQRAERLVGLMPAPG